MRIEVEDREIGDVFAKTINKDTIISSSKDSFFDIEKIFHVLQNYIKSSKESLSLTEDGKFTFAKIYPINQDLLFTLKNKN